MACCCEGPSIVGLVQPSDRCLLLRHLARLPSAPSIGEERRTSETAICTSLTATILGRCLMLGGGGKHWARMREDSSPICHMHPPPKCATSSYFSCFSVSSVLTVPAERPGEKARSMLRQSPAAPFLERIGQSQTPSHAATSRDFGPLCITKLPLPSLSLHVGCSRYL